ncbi:hypothetical protein GCM10025858_34820 [Alicyclobacillus sacchari]|nr:hypothetical protein GCM10025858_34820 [Alicyclobacillus sacchari]
MQVNGDTPFGKRQGAIVKCRTNPKSCLTYGGIGQSYNRKARKSRSDIGLHIYKFGLNAVVNSADGATQHIEITSCNGLHTRA